jgi:hypothetical protein
MAAMSAPNLPLEGRSKFARPSAAGRREFREGGASRSAGHSPLPKFARAFGSHKFRPPLKGEVRSAKRAAVGARELGATIPQGEKLGRGGVGLEWLYP